jgi:hypothetical protein
MEKESIVRQQGMVRKGMLWQKEWINKGISRDEKYG